MTPFFAPATGLLASLDLLLGGRAGKAAKAS
jgi:hypothetical protein